MGYLVTNYPSLEYREPMDYQRIKIAPLSSLPERNKLLYKVAVLFAKTGFYEKSIKLKNKDQDPFNRIIEAHITPNIDDISIVFYDEEFVGFYFAHLIRNTVIRELSDILPPGQINWNNHGSVLYKFYDVYFRNNEFLIDNMAFTSQFQRKGIYSKVVYPLLLKKAKDLNATNLVIAVFKYQNNNAYQLYLKQGFKQIANLQFQLEKVIISPNDIIEKTTEELILLRLAM